MYKSIKKTGLCWLLILSCFFGFSQSHSSFLLVENELITGFLERSTDSLKTTLAKAIYKEDIQQEISIRRILGTIYFEKGAINQALEYLISAKNLCEHYHYEYEKALTYEKLANVYMLIFEHEKHYKLITEAIQIFEQQKDTLSLARAYNNLAGGEKFRDKENTFFYLNKAMFYATSLKNELIIAEININYGTLFLREKQYDSATYRFNSALPVVQKHVAIGKECETLIKLGRAYKYNDDSSAYYFNEAYQKSIAYNNYLYKGRSLYFIATHQYERGKKNAAFNTIRQALYYHELTNDIAMNIGSLELISGFFLQENKMDSAFYYDQLADNLKDTVMMRQNLAEIKDVEWSYVLKDKQQVISNLKEKQLVLEQKQKAEQKAKIWFWITLFILMILCIAIFFFFKNRISLLNKERQLVQLKSEKQKMELEQKNKELVAHTMQIYSKSTTILEIKKNIEELKSKYVNSQEPKLIKDIQRLNFMLDNNIRLDEEWEKLKIRFQEIHQGFYEKLKDKHEDFTQYDLKICTFIFLGFDTKQIAQILNIDYQSLRTQRYRMRKKMQLKTDENLVEYIFKIVTE